MFYEGEDMNKLGHCTPLITSSHVRSAYPQLTMLIFNEGQKPENLNKKTLEQTQFIYDMTGGSTQATVVKGQRSYYVKLK